MIPKSYSDIQSILTAAHWDHRYGRKVQWKQLKQALIVAWDKGYIHHQGGVKPIKANTKIGRATLLELGQQFYHAKLVTKSTLKKEYGWTERLFKKYELTPDLRLKNPHYRYGSLMKLYSLSRVERISLDHNVLQDLAAVLEQRPARQVGAKKAAQTRKENQWVEHQRMLQSFESFLYYLDFQIPILEVPELLSNALRRARKYSDERLSLKDLDPHHCYLICRNYLALDCANFNQLMNANYDFEHRELIHRWVDQLIDQLYPCLEDNLEQLIAARS